MSFATRRPSARGCCASSTCRGKTFYIQRLTSCGLLCLPRKNNDCFPLPTPNADMSDGNLERRVVAEPTRAEIVEFIRLGLQCNLLSINAIRAWADTVIEEEDSPPDWSIDLAMAGPEDIHDIARHIPLSTTADRPMELLLGYCARPVAAPANHSRANRLGLVASLWRRACIFAQARPTSLRLLRIFRPGR